MGLVTAKIWLKNPRKQELESVEVNALADSASVGWVANWDGENCEFSDSHAGALIVIHKYLSS